MHAMHTKAPNVSSPLVSNRKHLSPSGVVRPNVHRAVCLSGGHFKAPHRIFGHLCDDFDDPRKAFLRTRLKSKCLQWALNLSEKGLERGADYVLWAFRGPVAEEEDTDPLVEGLHQLQLGESMIRSADEMRWCIARCKVTSTSPTDMGFDASVTMSTGQNGMCRCRMRSAVIGGWNALSRICPGLSGARLLLTWGGYKFTQFAPGVSWYSQDVPPNPRENGVRELRDSHRGRQSSPRGGTQPRGFAWFEGRKFERADNGGSRFAGCAGTFQEAILRRLGEGAQELAVRHGSSSVQNRPDSALKYDGIKGKMIEFQCMQGWGLGTGWLMVDSAENATHDAYYCRWLDNATYLQSTRTISEARSAALIDHNYTYYMDKADKEWLDKTNYHCRVEEPISHEPWSACTEEVCIRVPISVDEFKLVMGVFEILTAPLHPDTFASPVMPAWIPPPSVLTLAAQLNEQAEREPENTLLSSTGYKKTTKSRYGNKKYLDTRGTTSTRFQWQRASVNQAVFPSPTSILDPDTRLTWSARLLVLPLQREGPFCYFVVLLFFESKAMQIKSNFCSGVAKMDTYGTEVAIRESYDTGRWSIPCYYLECVAYDMALHYTLTTTAANLHRELGL
ncbi:hypothetical protein B0H14DRAFT_3133802 [Mycena olivaceomarginata]|nr:hypothetical protein B0H14DRAFT_3133802 [Mycena olivaceomarginata]